MMLKSKSDKREKLFTHVDHGIELKQLDSTTTESGRYYTTPSGISYPSVTTVLSVQDKSGLLEWRKRVGEEEANRISTQATRRGTAVHLLAENYLNNIDSYIGKAMPTDVMSFEPIRKILDARVDNIYFQEAPLYSNKLKTAGRVDLIAEFDSELSVIDFKTSRKPKKAEWITSYFLQESVYAAAYYELTGIPIRQIVTIITVDDSAPQIFIEQPLKWLPEFIKLRNRYREINGI